MRIKINPNCFVRIMALLFFIPAKSQIQNSYLISSIGTTGSTNPVFAGSFYLNGNACFQLKTGLETLQVPGIGIFSSACAVYKEDDPDRRILLSAYPNPVITSVIIRVSGGAKFFDFEEDKATFRLFSVEGQLLQTYITEMNVLNTGFEIKMNNLLDGTYLLKVYDDNHTLQTFKIIKTH